MPNSRITTRTTNKNAHPGLIAFDSETARLPIPQPRKPRRSQAEMQADKAAAEAIKEAKDVKSKEAIKKVAQVENQMVAADKDNRQTAARPAAKFKAKVACRPAALNSDDEQDISMFLLHFNFLKLITSYQEKTTLKNSLTYQEKSRMDQSPRWQRRHDQVKTMLMLRKSFSRTRARRKGRPHWVIDS